MKIYYQDKDYFCKNFQIKEYSNVDFDKIILFFKKLYYI